ncbi:MAG: hypothetical protein EHM42_13625, partial [Planctomycetaceae bacterium]
MMYARRASHVRGERRLTLLFSVCVCIGLTGCGGSSSTATAPAVPAVEVIEKTAEKGPVTLKVTVWPAEPKLSDLVEMDVVVSSEPEVELKAPVFGQGVGEFLVRDYSERPVAAGQVNSRHFHYQLEPVSAGKNLIHSVAVEFIDRRANSESKGEPALIE